jgi:hypothetical protein
MISSVETKALAKVAKDTLVLRHLNKAKCLPTRSVFAGLAGYLEGSVAYNLHSVSPNDVLSFIKVTCITEGYKNVRSRFGSKINWEMEEAVIQARIVDINEKTRARI